MESCPLDVHALKKLRIHFAQPGGKMILFGSIDLFYRNDAKLKKIVNTCEAKQHLEKSPLK